MKRTVLLIALLLLASFAAAGCSSVDYLQNVSHSFETLQSLNDRLVEADRNHDDAALLRTLADMKRETDAIAALEPGSLTKKAAEQVRDKNEVIAALVDALLAEAKAERPDRRKMDGDMKRLNAEIWDTDS